MTRSPYLDEAVREFNEGKYLDAHETLEEFWIDAPRPERDFLQGLIQLATGWHHLENGNLTGARLQFQKALKRLRDAPEVYEDIDIAAVRKFLEVAPQTMQAGGVVHPPVLR